MNRPIGNAVRGVVVGAVLLVTGCVDGMVTDSEDTAPVVTFSDGHLTQQQRAGELLFDNQTFRGNGRTCRTCHGDQTGTLSPRDVQDLAAEDDGAPLFRPIDADVAGGNTYDRLLTDATIRVLIPLPANVSIAGDSTRSAELFRGIPTTMNTPALDPVLMLDGRAATLQVQAAGAIQAHLEPGRTARAAELDAIAAYEKTQFNRQQLAVFANGGPAPVLPPGRTASEKRGRVFFEDSSAPVPRCAHCHFGPMLNETSPGLQALIGVPAGSRFFTALVSEFRFGGGQVRTYVFTDAAGNQTSVDSPDPGRALITGNAADANLFKIPTVWGAKNTAPYFHNNSAKSLTELLDHYGRMFQALGFSITEQDKLDIIAYVKLL